MMSYLNNPPFIPTLLWIMGVVSLTLAITCMWDTVFPDGFGASCRRSWAAVVGPRFRRAWWRLITLGRYQQYRAVIGLATADIAAVKRELAEDIRERRPTAEQPNPLLAALMRAAKARRDEG